MASTDEPCCGHMHTEPGELWVTADELIGMIEDGIDAAFALPSDATKADRRAAMRTRFDERRQAEADTPPLTAAERRDERARHRWGGT